MAESACPELDHLAKPANEESTIHSGYNHYYAVTMKPNMKIEQNNHAIMESVLDYQFGYPYDHLIADKKYEMDSYGVLHLHFTLKRKSKLKSYRAFFKKGWMIHLSYLKGPQEYEKWTNYLTKGDPNDQVLLLAQARTEYMFQ